MRGKTHSILLLSGILSILVPVGATQAFSGTGSGTEQDPYIITDVNQLQEMNNDLDAWYELGNNIDASATEIWNEDPNNPGTYFGFAPIGEEYNEFRGCFDGKGYTITGLYIYRPGMNRVALFGVTYWSYLFARIKNIGLIEADVTGHYNVGALAGQNLGLVYRCYSTGRVTATGSGAGGLIGVQRSGTNWTAEVSESYSTAELYGWWTVGGLVGNNGASKITNCYATGSVSATANPQGIPPQHVGGLVGYVYINWPDVGSAVISNCYSTGSVINIADSGGLIGFQHYFSPGDPTGMDCFWDIETSGQTTSAGGTGKTTAEMKQQATFTNWGFDTVWDIVEGVTYPFLREELSPLPVKGIDVSSWQRCEEKGGQDIDWSQVYGEGYRFALVRASWWYNGIDDCFVTNMEDANTAGMLVGAYHFAYPEYADAGSEARHFVNVAGDYLKEGYLRPALDIENDPDSSSYPYNLGPEGLSDWVHEWMNTVKAEARLKHGTTVEPMLYVNRDYADFLDERLAGVYDLWIAHPTCNPDGEPDTKKWENWAFWQYYMPEPDGPCPDNSTGPDSVPGIDTSVDLDVFNGDMSRLKTFKISDWQPDFWILSHLCSRADMVVTDPDGLIISREQNQIPGAAYVEIDVDGDGDLDEEISIPYRKVGYYQITVVPEPEVLPTDIYSLKVTIDGQTMVLAEDVQIEDIPAEPYEFESKLNRSDFDTDGDVDFADYAIFANHWSEQDCNYPNWCEGTDLDYSGFIDFIDFAIFAEDWLWGKIPADLNIDGGVDFVDYAVLANHWMDQNCAGPNWCSGADLNKSGSVDLYDLGKLADNWLEGK